jgi:DnaJ family protein A protein 2
MRTQMTMLGPGMYSQSTGPCSDCNGTGTQIDEKDKCRDCNGKKVVKEKKVLECQIDKGSPHGAKYLFHGESDEYPDVEPGDVVIVVNEQPHNVFKRKGADLFMEKEITLLESLTGVSFVIDFLDGSKFAVSSPAGQVIKPNQLMTIEEKGLPFYKNPYKYGNLFVLFTVKFPETLDTV